jgi:methylated-DNA-[protein]-cysteine S-methyltransferase
MVIRVFRERVHAIVSQIPPGKTMTYSEVARLSGSPGAAQAVGQVLKKNFDPMIPCHRVVRADGGIGGYNRGVDRKARLLSEEYAAVCCDKLGLCS